MELALKFGRGGVVKGPATYFLDTQEAIVFVTLEPWMKALAEFLTEQAPRFSDWNAGAPVDK